MAHSGLEKKSPAATKDWLLKWVQEGSSFYSFPLDQPHYSDLRQASAIEPAKQVMQRCSEELWKAAFIERTSQRLKGVRWRLFWDWASPSEVNDWKHLLDAESRGEILLQAFSDLEAFVALKHPGHQGARAQLQYGHKQLVAAVQVAKSQDSI